ncbi:hypothetical protein FJZ36_15540 [Candidatus Poribacteria bacterium]|nr:hypothetical protein [Candidatus Poribacteria bacterium]
MVPIAVGPDVIVPVTAIIAISALMALKIVAGALTRFRRSVPKGLEEQLASLRREIAEMRGQVEALREAHADLTLTIDQVQPVPRRAALTDDRSECP